MTPHRGLINLILCVLGVILTAAAFIRALMWRRKEDNYHGCEEQQPRLVWLVAALILAIAGVIFFLITEDMRLPTMVAVDIWTIVNAIIFVLGVLSILLTFSKEKEEYRRSGSK